MNDAEARFAERLAEDLDRVLGAGIAIDDVEIEAGEPGGNARVRATLLVGERIETIEAVGTDVLALYRPILERAAQMRLASAWWRLVGPT